MLISGSWYITPKCKVHPTEKLQHYHHSQKFSIILVHSKSSILISHLLGTVTTQWLDSDSVQQKCSHHQQLLAARWLHCHWQFIHCSCRQLLTVTSPSPSSHCVVTVPSRWLIEKEFCCVWLVIILSMHAVLDVIPSSTSVLQDLQI